MELQDTLRSISSVAIVGLGNSPDRPAYEVAQFLLEHGIEITPVHPQRPRVFDKRAYARLSDIPSTDRPDAACLFVRPEIAEEIVEEIRSLGQPAVIWMQPGALHQEAADRAERDGFVVVRGKCIMAELRRSLGEQGLL